MKTVVRLRFLWKFGPRGGGALLSRVGVLMHDWVGWREGGGREEGENQGRIRLLPVHFA